MGLFHQVAARLSLRKPIKPQPVQPGSQLAPQPSTSQSPIQSLEELEQRMQQEAQMVTAHPLKGQRNQTYCLKRTFNRLIWSVALLGIPVGAIAVINLPYAPIRRPIAEKAPILLMPSYISMDNHFRRAVSSIETAKQLIDQATTAADLQLGEQKLQQAQDSLNQLPTWVWSELPDTRAWWWYDWRISAWGFNSARAEVGRLQGKLFQEKNGQAALAQAEQTLAEANQQDQEARNSLEKQAAARVRQDGLEQLRQVPPTTLAGRTAQQRLASIQSQLQTSNRLAADAEQANNLVSAARQFAWRAAQASQHPPHSVAEWQQVIDLWQMAIQPLKQVSSSDPGYTEAQKLMADYSANLGEIQVRQQAEATAVQSLKLAKAQIIDLIAATPATADRNRTASQIQQIINQLETIDSGTTAYPEAQTLLLSAKTKMRQLTP
jgi:hypothetical protein